MSLWCAARHVAIPFNTNSTIAAATRATTKLGVIVIVLMVLCYHTAKRQQSLTE